MQSNRVESTTFAMHPALPSSVIFCKYGANRLLACRIDTKGDDSCRIDMKGAICLELCQFDMRGAIRHNWIKLCRVDNISNAPCLAQFSCSF